MNATKTAPKKPQVKTVEATTKVKSEYVKNVIDTNRALKTEYRTLGGCIKQLLFFKDEAKLPKSYIARLEAINKDADVYKDFIKRVRTSKKGNYAPFFVLQAIHKSIKESNPTYHTPYSKGVGASKNK